MANRAIQEEFMWLLVAIILLLLWAAGFLAFHVAGALIHLLILVAIAAFAIHIIQGRRPAL
jgi:hypothetical protein